MAQLEINEVAPRDGFQIETNFIPTDEKVRLIDALSVSGLARVEVSSFVSPRAVPNLRDAEEVVRAIRRHPGVGITVLVPNKIGAERALACGVDEINLVMSTSDSHSKVNLGMTPEQSLEQFSEIMGIARNSGVFMNASLSTSFGCPFEGKVPETRVFEIVESLLRIGIDGVTLCDTTGVANPAQVAKLSGALIERFSDTPFTLHFHNTRGMGLANALAAWQVGVVRFDASLGGLGGCPFAPGATGNVCTEDLVHMFAQMGVSTGVDIDALIAISATLPKLVGHETPGQVVKAGTADKRYSIPMH